jgi:peptide-methionine (S)-S-oxide reductase
MEKATFGAGCFWGVEVRFGQIPGVAATSVGYEGGKLANPTYRDVCTNRTGHAEVVQLAFDPTVVSYETLLNVFFSLHDPTQLDRQGPDWGSQYRSVVFFHSAEQEATAKEVMKRLEQEKQLFRPIVTQLIPAQTYWAAEEYHQKYLEKRGAVSCHI